MITELNHQKLSDGEIIKNSIYDSQHIVGFYR